MDQGQSQPPGWYYAEGDPSGTQRYWDGQTWQGNAQPIPGGAVSGRAAELAELASPVKRMLARFVDSVIWLLLSLVVAIPFAFIFGVGLDTSQLDNYLGQLVAGLIVIAYEIIMVTRTGATVGKRLLGIKVTTESGDPPGIEVAARRMLLLLVYNLVRIVPPVAALVFVGLALVGFWMLISDERHQTPWDKLGNTLVKER